MTTEDLQEQLSRSAAVERELREKIAQLQRQVEEAKSAAALTCYQGGTAAGEVLAKMQAEIDRFRAWAKSYAAYYSRDARELKRDASALQKRGEDGDAMFRFGCADYAAGFAKKLRGLLRPAPDKRTPRQPAGRRSDG